MLTLNFYAPLPYVLHPDADGADASAATWMKKFNLCENEIKRKLLEHAGCGKLASYIIPFSRKDVLYVAADFFIWNVSFDDEYCDDGLIGRQPGRLASTLSQIQRAIECPEVPLYTFDKYAVALRDIRVRLDRCSTPANVDRWVEGIRVWFLAEVWRAGNEERGITLSLDDYAVMRLWCGGAYAFLALGPIAEGYELRADELKDRRVQALFEIAATLCNWAADVIGHVRDGRDEGGNNLLSVIQREFSCSMTEAVERSITMHAQIMSLFIRLRDDVAKGASPQLARYLVSLGHYCRCGIDWVAESSRYTNQSSGHPSVEVRTTETWPADQDPLSPLPIPSIAWWWQYDPARLSEESQELEQSAG